MTSHAVHIQVWQLKDKKKQQWQPKCLTEGSPIEVDFSEEDIFWAWRRIEESNQYFWQFSLNLRDQETLYVTYGDDNDVRLQSNTGSNSNFEVYVSHHRGYVIRVPATQKYLAAKEGLLVLSHIPAVWFLKSEHGDIDGSVINMTEDGDQSMMWMYSSTSVQGDELIVAKSTQSDEDAQWYHNYVLSEDSYQIQPKNNKDLYVACDVPNETVILGALSGGVPENSTFLKATPVQEYTDVGYIQNHAKTRYFNTQDGGYETTLSLTDSERLAVAWKPKLCYFDINDGLYPPDPKRESQSTVESCELV